MNIYHTSEQSIICVLKPPAELVKQQQIWQMAELIQQLPNVVEIVVGMNNFTVFHNMQADTDLLKQQLQETWQTLSQQQNSRQGKIVEIPVHYGGEYGEDLANVAAYHQTTPEEIIQRHTNAVYTVFMIGFQPGFPYLGGLPENLHTPRHKVPRTRVPAGSVGIGGSQTGIYPFTSPGGWQLLGKTDLPLFDITKTPPVLLQTGDTVRFIVESVKL
ncbi:hypothetical protein A6B43_05040 [Vespertiliibacter pulmonis]|uniref:KipI family sensor histidine kinase inhibitor n=1 Tax=Vespertiliibacter pulmonis TaxID=1443036 RepID=A0A3N4VPU2_9PAST|nr:5-oxoprolinase subunit PxpB [Vespertiliibacter pulmonis]QLB20936.1 hypothetical protein A6B43_05040 [Vespertiliibacter pulmonis]RPE83593.1 KipI family sensor histidine kinase inhibitor [Vespertiliibacter pulmonis]